MSAELRRIAVVPAFNEDKNIARVVAELKEHDPGIDVVVVSDGSIDRTYEVARAAGARVLRLPFNLGIGGAVQTGFRYAWENGYDLAVRCDGDGQHIPAELPKVIAPVVAGDADIAIGSRFVSGGGYRSSATRRARGCGCRRAARRRSGSRRRRRSASLRPGRPRRPRRARRGCAARPDRAGRRRRAAPPARSPPPTRSGTPSARRRRCRG